MKVPAAKIISSSIVSPIRKLAVAPTDNALLTRKVAAGINDANARGSPGLGGTHCEQDTGLALRSNAEARKCFI
jgi:hypothetical protein